MSEADAIEMVEVLADVGLYEYIGGAPPTVEELRLRYARQAAGSPHPGAVWLNWILRRRADGSAIGTTQAEIFRGPNGMQASIAWVSGQRFQGNGFASEAASAVVSRLVAHGIGDIHATIHPDHGASARVAVRAGLVATAETRDGETVWKRQATGAHRR